MPGQTEVPGVNNAVGKLEELAQRMRGEDFGFKDNDVSNIDKVIEALHELEQERKHLHDELETETIKASVNRHKLQFLPAQIKDEIMVAVNSARQSNAKAQQELQDTLDNINRNIVYLGDRHQELEKENSVLHPERELVRQQHEEIISQLNQRMAEKASMQIALNETRDKVRQANQNIVDLEDGILQLKEDLIQERTEARHEKKRLKRAVADTQEKTKEQREQNMGKKKELDSFQETLVDSEGKLDAIRKSIRRFETSKSRLEDEERNLNARLAKEVRINKELKERGKAIEAESQREQSEFATFEKELASKIQRFESDIAKEEEKFGDLEMKKLTLQTDLKDKMTIRRKDHERVKSLDETLQTTKAALTRKAEDVGRMQAENIDMTEEIENLAESHKAVLAQLNKQVEECRELLSNERKERMEMQSKKDGVHKNLEEFKTEQQRFMQSVNHKIQDGKTKHVELSNEGATIQKELRKDEEDIQGLQSQLGKLQQEFDNMFTSLQGKTETMEQEIMTMESDEAKKNQLISEKTPVFEELEQTFEERNEAYDKMKKDVVVLKNQKTSLEDAIKKAKREKETMGPPQMQLREDLKEHREQSLQQMRELGVVTQETEKQIYLEGSKLKTVMEENHRFEESCKKMEADILDLQQQMEMNEKMTSQLQQELVKSKADLASSWQADRVMQELFADRDQDMVEAFGHLLEKTERRETTISDVTDKLSGELQTLASFLDNVSSRRPRETRSAKRPVTGGSTHRARSAVEAVAAVNLAASSGSPRPPSVSMRASLLTKSERSVGSRPATAASRQSQASRTPRDRSPAAAQTVVISP